MKFEAGLDIRVIRSSTKVATKLCSLSSETPPVVAHSEEVTEGVQDIRVIRSPTEVATKLCSLSSETPPAVAHSEERKSRRQEGTSRVLLPLEGFATGLRDQPSRSERCVVFMHPIELVSIVWLDGRISRIVVWVSRGLALATG